jgi:hypothetical protein
MCVQILQNSQQLEQILWVPVMALKFVQNSCNFPLMFTFFIHVCKSLISWTQCNTSNHECWLLGATYRPPPPPPPPPLTSCNTLHSDHCARWQAVQQLTLFQFVVCGVSYILVQCTALSNMFLLWKWCPSAHRNNHLTNMLLTAQWSSASEIKKGWHHKCCLSDHLQNMHY